MTQIHNDLYGVKNKEGKEPRLLQIFGEKEDKILILKCMVCGAKHPIRSKI